MTGSHKHGRWRIQQEEFVKIIPEAFSWPASAQRSLRGQSIINRLPPVGTSSGLPGFRSRRPVWMGYTPTRRQETTQKRVRIGFELELLDTLLQGSEAST